jgi:hypothetical protein
MDRLMDRVEEVTGPKPGPNDAGQRPDPNRRDSQRIVFGSVLSGLLMIIALAFFAFQPGGPGVGAFGTGVVVGGGGVAVGALLGLLFGVPRLLEQPKNATTVEGAAPTGSGYQANTNLTEISDWLTKIIVGISLIQLGTIRDQLLALVEALAPGFGTSAGAAPFVAGLLATSTFTGFLTGYLLARIYLPRVFNEADVIFRVTEASRRVVVAAVQQQTIDSSEADAAAIRLIDQALSSSASAQQPSSEDLTEALRRASPGTRAFIVSRAADLRSSTWESDKATMALTIPVFRALLQIDDTDHYVHGQLGFALKDHAQADNAGSIAELSRAIELRGDAETGGWLFYEWNRALARVRAELATNRPSEAAVKDTIVSDLSAAFRIPDLRDLAVNDPDFTKWAKQNRVDLARLKAA